MYLNLHYNNIHPCILHISVAFIKAETQSSRICSKWMRVPIPKHWAEVATTARCVKKFRLRKLMHKLTCIWIGTRIHLAQCVKTVFRPLVTSCTVHFHVTRCKTETSPTKTHDVNAKLGRCVSLVQCWWLQHCQKMTDEKIPVQLHVVHHTPCNVKSMTLKVCTLCCVFMCLLLSSHTVSSICSVYLKTMVFDKSPWVNVMHCVVFAGLLYCRVSRSGNFLNILLDVKHEIKLLFLAGVFCVFFRFPIIC